MLRARVGRRAAAEHKSHAVELARNAFIAKLKKKAKVSGEGRPEKRAGVGSREHGGESSSPGGDWDDNENAATRTHSLKQKSRDPSLNAQASAARRSLTKVFTNEAAMGKTASLIDDQETTPPRFPSKGRAGKGPAMESGSSHSPCSDASSRPVAFGISMQASGTKTSKK